MLCVYGFVVCENKWRLWAPEKFKLHGPSMFAVKAKIYGVLYNSPALSLLMKHLAIGQRLKTPNFSAFHWSPRGSLVSIGQHVVASRVVHLPKSTETSLITESDQRGPNHQLLQLCTARTAWSDSARLCGPCIAVIAGLVVFSYLWCCLILHQRHQKTNHTVDSRYLEVEWTR